MKTSITWLHLSDLHFRESTQGDANAILRSLLGDIRECIEKDSLQPDFIVLSGDIAFGGKPAEYMLARQFLDKLLDISHLGKERLFAVPGNHDVDRSMITGGARAIVSSVGSREALASLIATPEDQELVLLKLKHYDEFASEYGGIGSATENVGLAVEHRLEFAGRSVVVLSLNSAWLSMGDEDQGRLALGKQTVRQALDESNGADLRLVPR